MVDDYQLIISWSSTDNQPQSFHLQSTDNRYSAKKTWGWTMQRFPAGASYSSVSKMPPRPIKHPTPALAPPVLLALEVSCSCSSCNSMALGISLLDQPDQPDQIKIIHWNPFHFCYPLDSTGKWKTWNHQKPPAMNSRLPPGLCFQCWKVSAFVCCSLWLKTSQGSWIPPISMWKTMRNHGKTKRGMLGQHLFLCCLLCVFCFFKLLLLFNVCSCCFFFPVGFLGLFWC